VLSFLVDKVSVEDAYEQILSLAGTEKLSTIPSCRYKYVLVDDIQDFTELQYRMIKTLFLDSRQHNMGCLSFIACGDDDQSIFWYFTLMFYFVCLSCNPKCVRWKGAKDNVISEIAKDLPHAATYCLVDNLRNSQHILDSARRLIANNKNRIEIKMPGVSKSLKYIGEDKSQAASRSSDSVNLQVFEDSAAEVDGVVQHIKSLLGTDTKSSSEGNFQQFHRFCV